MGVQTPATSPWVQPFEDYLGRVIRITVVFDVASRAITGITVFRDAACVFTKILIGVGADGIPDNTDKAINVPSGTTVSTAQQLAALAAKGLSTIEDIQALQITAGR